MIDIQLNLEPQTEKRLQTILSQHPNQEAFAQNVIAYQIAELNRAILNLRLDIQLMEEKYLMDSGTFYEQFQAGKMDDSDDFLLWAGLIEMLQDNQSKLKEMI